MSAPDDVLADRTEVFGTVFVLTHRLGHRMDAELARLGLTTRQWLLLAVIDRWFADRPPSLTEAAARYGSSRQNVKQIAIQLERAGYLRLERDAGDGRVIRLVTTDRVDMFHRPDTVERILVFLDEVFAPLGARDVRTLRRLLTRWSEGLAPGGPGGGR